MAKKKEVRVVVEGGAVVDVTVPDDSIKVIVEDHDLGSEEEFPCTVGDSAEA